MSVPTVLRYVTVPAVPTATPQTDEDLPMASVIKMGVGPTTCPQDVLPQLDKLIGSRHAGRVREAGPCELLYYPPAPFGEAGHAAHPPVAIPLGSRIVEVEAIQARIGAEGGVTLANPLVLVLRKKQPKTQGTLLGGGGSGHAAAAAVTDPTAAAASMVAARMAEMRAAVSAKALPTRVPWLERLQPRPTVPGLQDAIADEEEALHALLQALERRNAELRAQRSQHLQRVQEAATDLAQMDAEVSAEEDAVRQRDALSADVERLRTALHVQRAREAEILLKASPSPERKPFAQSQASQQYKGVLAGAVGSGGAVPQPEATPTAAQGTTTTTAGDDPRYRSAVDSVRQAMGGLYEPAGGAAAVQGQRGRYVVAATGNDDFDSASPNYADRQALAQGPHGGAVSTRAPSEEEMRAAGSALGSADNRSRSSSAMVSNPSATNPNGVFGRSQGAAPPRGGNGNGGDFQPQFFSDGSPAPSPHERSGGGGGGYSAVGRAAWAPAYDTSSNASSPPAAHHHHQDDDRHTLLPAAAREVVNVDTTSWMSPDLKRRVDAAITSGGDSDSNNNNRHRGNPQQQQQQQEAPLAYLRTNDRYTSRSPERSRYTYDTAAQPPPSLASNLTDYLRRLDGGRPTGRRQELLATLESRRAMATNQPFYPEPRNPSTEGAYQDYFRSTQQQQQQPIQQQPLLSHGASTYHHQPSPTHHYENNGYANPWGPADHHHYHHDPQHQPHGPRPTTAGAPASRGVFGRTASSSGASAAYSHQQHQQQPFHHQPPQGYGAHGGSPDFHQHH